MRGVGKTTLLWQLASYIYHNHTKNVFFFNVNIIKTIGVSLFDVLEAFQQNVLKKRFTELTEPVVLLFDEVHDDEKWAQTLKILYDQARFAFIVATGSSALLLTQTADLARRMKIQHIFPLKFTEFVRIKAYLDKGKSLHFNGLGKKLSDALFYSEDIKELEKRIKSLEKSVNRYYEEIAQFGYDIDRLFDDYISYQNIPAFLFYRERRAVSESILELFRRVIVEDIPKSEAGVDDRLTIERLLLRLAGSDELNPDKLAGLVGLKRDKVLLLIDVLAKAELLNVLQPYGGLDTKVLKNRKAFFMSPSLRKALLWTLYGDNLPKQMQSMLLEDLVVLYLKMVLNGSVISYTSGSAGSHPDIVIETRDKPVLLEIGTHKTSIKQLVSCKIPYRYVILLTDGVSAPTVKDNVLLLPMRWWSLI